MHIYIIVTIIIIIIIIIITIYYWSEDLATAPLELVILTMRYIDQTNNEL